MTASSTSGQKLEDEELDIILKACDKMIEIDMVRVKIFTYVESQMDNYAPNLTALVGPEIAAKLLGSSGGIDNLAKMPSGNLKLLGKKVVVLNGFSSMNAPIHIGYINDCDLIQRCPPSLRKKVRRIVSDKCSLAARADAFHKDKDGSQGRKLREEIEKKIKKLQEPPPPRKEKPLPAPDDIVKKRRGGARMRKLKQRYAQTELRKRANRLTFGKISEEYGNTFKDFGQIGMDDSGMIRLGVRDVKGFKVKTRKRNRKGLSTEDGTTSVYTMTPLEGLTLLPPENSNEEDVRLDYFSNNLTFNKKPEEEELDESEEPSKKRKLNND